MAFQWAGARSLVRTNEMHGEEEAKLILSDNFSFNEQEGEREERAAGFTTQASRQNTTAKHGPKDPEGEMFNSGVIGATASAEAMLQHGESGENHAQQVAKQSGSFRLLGEQVCF